MIVNDRNALSLRLLEAEGLEDFVGMEVGFHFPEDVGDDSIWSDDDGGPFDTHIFTAIHRLLHPHAVGG